MAKPVVRTAAEQAEALAAEWRRDRRQWREERRERLGYALPADDDEVVVRSRPAPAHEEPSEPEPAVEAAVRRRSAALERRAAIVALWDGGLRSKVDIAKRVGVTSARVGQVLAEERPNEARVRKRRC